MYNFFKTIKNIFITILKFLMAFSVCSIVLYSFTGCGLDIGGLLTDEKKISYVIADYCYMSKDSMNNARGIIEEYKDLNDIDKLHAYYYKIMDLNSYNYELNKNQNRTNEEYFNGSCVTYVFDNNDETKTMCLGYAQSFKYLCDNSTFNSDIKCDVTIVSVNNSSHAINTIRINDKYYHLDCCWGDTDYGHLESFFLVELPELIDDYYLNYSFTLITNKAKNETRISEKESYITVNKEVENNYKYYHFIVNNRETSNIKMFPFYLFDTKLFDFKG